MAKRLVLLLAIAFAIGPALAASAATRPINIARFEGRWIDLQRGWDGARACVVYIVKPTQCYRDSSEAKRAESRLSPSTLNCGSSLDLYDGTYMSGASVSILARGTWINLSTVGFDNRTSSYVVGACSVDLASGTGGGGSRYGRCLSPGCAEFT